MAAPAKTKAPAVQGYVTRTQEVDFRASLDGWTLYELEEYLAGEDDGEGHEILASDSYVIADEVDDVDLPTAAFAEYVAWRRSNGLTGRLT